MQENGLYYDFSKKEEPSNVMKAVSRMENHMQNVEKKKKFL